MELLPDPVRPTRPMDRFGGRRKDIFFNIGLSSEYEKFTLSNERWEILSMRSRRTRALCLAFSCLKTLIIRSAEARAFWSRLKVSDRSLKGLKKSFIYDRKATSSPRVNDLSITLKLPVQRMMATLSTPMKPIKGIKMEKILI